MTSIMEAKESVVCEDSNLIFNQPLITITAAHYDKPVGKSYVLKDGAIASKETLDRTDGGVVRVHQFYTIQEYAQFIANADGTVMRVCGNVVLEDSGKPLKYRTDTNPNAVALSNDYLKFREGPAIMSIDVDYKSADEVAGLYPAECKQFESHEAFLKVLFEVAPELDDVYMLVRDSSSSRLVDDDGVEVTGLRGIHIDIPISNGEAIPGVLQNLFDRFWLAGHGWAFVDTAGRIHLRAPVDLVMGRPHQPDFIKPTVIGGEHAGQITVRGSKLYEPDIVIMDEQQRKQLDYERVTAESYLEDTAKQIIQERIGSKTTELIKRGVNKKSAERQAKNMYEMHQLEQDVPIFFREGVISTVGQLLGLDGAKFDLHICKDPLEPDYPTTAKFYWNGGVNPMIHSFAHGGRTYRLKQNAIDAVLASDEPDLVIQTAMSIVGSVQSRVGVDCVKLDKLFEEMRQIFHVPQKGKFMRLNTEGYLNTYTEKHLQVHHLKGCHSMLDIEAFEAHPRTQQPLWDLQVLNKYTFNKQTFAKLLSMFAPPGPTEAAGIVGEKLMDYLVNYRQTETIRRSVDMFIDAPTTKLHADGELEVVYPHTPFKEDWGVDAKTVKRVMADYTEHFPMFDELLEQLVAARFAADRKKAFDWLQCQSDWGKTFLVDGVFKRLGLVLATTADVIEKAFNGTPIGLDLSRAFRTWILFFDEWKKVKSELKVISSELTGAAKQQLQTTIPVYLKIAASAEGNEALDGEAGVEEQFANRICHIRGEGNLDKRPLFRELGREKYAKAVTTYVAKYLNQAVAEYVELGREAASLEGGEVLDAFMVKHGIRNTSASLADTIIQVADEIRHEIIEAHKKSYYYSEFTKMTRWRLSLRDNVIQVVKNKSENAPAYLLVKSPATIVREYIDLKFSHSERAKVAYKTADIRDLLGEEPYSNKSVASYIPRAGNFERITSKGVFIEYAIEKKTGLPDYIAKIKKATEE